MASSEMFKVDPVSLKPEADIILPDITVYEDRDFRGDSWRTSNGYSYVGDDWNDKISSFIIHSGLFEFYEDRDYGTSNWGPVRLGPGKYEWVADVGIGNDSITSWKAFYGAKDVEVIID